MNVFDTNIYRYCYLVLTLFRTSETTFQITLFEKKNYIAYSNISEISYLKGL